MYTLPPRPLQRLQVEDEKSEWFVFDSLDHTMTGKPSSVGLWVDSLLPASRKVLHLKLRVDFSVHGIDKCFPNLQSLYVSQEEWNGTYSDQRWERTGCELEGLEGLASTLTHLELRMSGQWMPTESHDDLSPIATLVNLRSLAMERLRDGFIEHYKCIEGLVNLENVYIKGTTYSHGSKKKKNQTSVPSEYTLDLSRLTKLKSLIWFEGMFCSVAELNTAWNSCEVGESLGGKVALVLPPNLEEIVFEIGIFGEYSSLMQDEVELLKKNGTKVFFGERKTMTKAFDSRYVDRIGNSTHRTQREKVWMVEKYFPKCVASGASKLSNGSEDIHVQQPAKKRRKTAKNVKVQLKCPKCSNMASKKCCSSDGKFYCKNCCSGCLYAMHKPPTRDKK